MKMSFTRFPKHFYDKYEGRIAASEQEMNIIKDMDLVYDLKMADKENEIHTTTGLEENGRNLYNRMTPAQKAAWDKHYDPIIKKFKEQKLTGKALAEWKYQQYMHDYMRVIHSVDRNVGVCWIIWRKAVYGKYYYRLYFRPGILYG